VVDVPKLKAPGFVTAVANGDFADSSSAADGGLTLMVRSNTSSYAGFRVSLYSGLTGIAGSYACAGGGSIPFSRGCFKGKFQVPPGDSFSPVTIPFANFTDLWSSATGEPTSTCVKDPSACLTASKLSKLKRVELWAEGVDGVIHLEVESISATAAAPAIKGGAGVELVEFDGSQVWDHTDDPVMGGKSKSSFSQAGGVGTFEGTCAIVPSLKAPGFCKVATSGGTFPDVSSFLNGSIHLTVRSSTPTFNGFRVAVDAKGLKCPGVIFSPFTTSWKSNFTVPPGDTFSVVKVPFPAFSCDWSSYTGDCSTKDPGVLGRQHYCCSDKHPEKCPSTEALSAISGVEVWAEGAEGDFHLELKSISAGPL